MWTCKQVGNALAAGRYRDLPWHRRLGLRLHVALCIVCHRYNKGVMNMQDIAAGFEKRELSGDLPPTFPGLGDEAKMKIADALKNSRSQSM